MMWQPMMTMQKDREFSRMAYFDAAMRVLSRHGYVFETSDRRIGGAAKIICPKAAGTDDLLFEVELLEQL